MATSEPTLADASLEQRYDAAIEVVRQSPEQGDVLLSYVLWPDRMPSLDLIARHVAMRRLTQGAEAGRLLRDLLPAAA